MVFNMFLFSSAQNIILTKGYTVAKLVDFDAAVKLPTQRKRIIFGTPGFAPYEVKTCVIVFIRFYSKISLVMSSSHSRQAFFVYKLKTPNSKFHSSFLGSLDLQLRR